MAEIDDVKENLPGWSRKQIMIAIIAITLLAGFLAILMRGLVTDPNQIPSALLNKKATEFRATWLQGKEHLPSPRDEGFALQDFSGQPLILNFWASWCYSCREEARDFEAFWQKYKGRGIRLAGIAIQDSPEEALKFAQTYGKTYMLGLDSEDGFAAINYGVTGVPETFFIDRNGIVLHKEAGPVNAKLLAEWAEKLLQTP